MELMFRPSQRLRFATLAVVFLFAGCNRIKPIDLRQLDQAGMWYQSLEDLRKLDPSGAEIAQLVIIRRAGMSDAACLDLVRLARSRQRPFDSGEPVAALLRVHMSEANILELARLDQLGLWVGEAQAMRLAGLSEDVVMAVARRRASGLQTLSGAALAQLKNVGVDEPQMMGLLNRGGSDAEAQKVVEARNRAATPSGFVRQPRRRR